MVGTAGSRITFTSSGYWDGIVISGVSTASDLQYCDFENVSNDGAVIYLYNALNTNVYKCKITNCFAYGGSAGIEVYGSSSYPTIGYCKIYDNDYGIITWEYSHPVVEYCWITENDNDGVYVIGNSWPTLQYNYIDQNNNDGIYSIISGRPYLYYNTIEYNGDHGLHAAGAYLGKIDSPGYRNYIYDNDADGIHNVSNSSSFFGCINDTIGLYEEGENYIRYNDGYEVYNTGTVVHAKLNY